MRKIYFITLIIFLQFELQGQVVISEVYGGAGCGTAGCSTYQNDFIELFNRGAATINLNGWSVQYAPATSSTWQVTNLPNVDLAPGKHLLIAEAFGINGINPLPAPDVTGTISMSATAGKVALVNVTAALTGACPVSASIVDLIGYGVTANCNEGGTNAPAPGTTTADLRSNSGCTDANNNGTDFTAGSPDPKNNSVAAAPCFTLPVLFVSVRAFDLDNHIRVEWSNLAETDVLSYAVERSANGRLFTSIDTMTANWNNAGRADYSYLDDSPLSGINFYRIRASELNGHTQYSIIVKVDSHNGKADLTIYPNPVVNKTITIQLTGLPKGEYGVIISNAEGREFHKRTFHHSGGAITESLSLPPGLKPGLYLLQIIGEYDLTSRFIVH